MIHLTPKELAKRWQVDRQHIYDLINSGRLCAFNVSTKRKPLWRITLEAIEAFERNQQKTVPDRPRRRSNRLPKPKQFV